MSKFQYELVKLFLDTFHIEPARLAREWKIAPAEVSKVNLSANYDNYRGLDFMNSMFGNI